MLERLRVRLTVENEEGKRGQRVERRGERHRRQAGSEGWEGGAKRTGVPQVDAG